MNIIDKNNEYFLRNPKNNFNIDAFLEAIDTKNVNEIENIIYNENSIIINNTVILL